MSLLIAVCSCQRDRSRRCHDKIRHSLAREVPADVRFFVGGTKLDNLLSDEVWLDVLDDYRNLPQKVRQICQWALAHDYAHLLKCDNDSVPFQDRLVKSNFQDFDYVGELSGMC